LDERLVHGGRILIRRVLDYAPEPGLEVFVFVGADRSVAGGAGVAETKDVAAKLQLGEGNPRGKVARVS
jgi:hypothetical protein